MEAMMGSSFKKFLATLGATVIAFLLVFVTSQILKNWLHQPWASLVAVAVWLLVFVVAIAAVLIRRRQDRKQRPPNPPGPAPSNPPD